MVPSECSLVQSEVSAPPLRFCKSGHVAPIVFAREPGGEVEPTRFFQLNSQANPSVNGVYCEPCLIVAHALARQQKEKIK